MSRCTDLGKPDSRREEKKKSKKKKIERYQIVHSKRSGLSLERVLLSPAETRRGIQEEQTGGRKEPS